MTKDQAERILKQHFSNVVTYTPTQNEWCFHVRAASHDFTITKSNDVPFVPYTVAYRVGPTSSFVYGRHSEFSDAIESLKKCISGIFHELAALIKKE